MEIILQKVVITLVNVQFSQKSLHFWDMDFMFVVWKCTDIYSGKSENHFCHNNPVTVYGGLKKKCIFRLAKAKMKMEKK